MKENLGLRVAAKAVIEAEDGILVLHPSEIDKNRLWHLPGGIRDVAEEDIAATAVREVFEETAIDLTNVPGQLLRYGEWPAVDQGEKVRILALFFHYKLDQRPPIVLSHEHVDAAWLDRNNYRQYPANPEVYEVVESLLIPQQG